MTDAVSKSIADIPLPLSEAERLAALYRYKVLDTPPEKAFDRITALAARLFDVPMVLISLVDESRVWFKSCYGFDLHEVSRDSAICNFAVLNDDVLVISDTQEDNQFFNHSWLSSETNVRFYASAPLLTQDGFNLGALCLVDAQPHHPFTDEQRATLEDLAAMVMDELELRLAAGKIAHLDAALLEITQGVSTVTGKAFFHALVQQLAKVLDVNYACISLLVNEQPEAVKTIAFCAQGEIIDNVEYELQGTPCLEVIRQQKLCCYPSNLQVLFPDDLFLVSLTIESYASIPFFDSHGKLLGLLGVMDNKPIDNIQLVESLLTLFAMRIAAELERHQNEEMQQESAQRLQLYADVVRNTQVGIVVWQLENLNDPGSFRLVVANPAASEVTGFNFEPMLGKTMAESFPKLLQTPLAQYYLEVVCTGQSLDLGEVAYAEDGISAGVYTLKAFPLPDHCLGLAFENITTRKRLEAQLQESQRYNQQIAEAVPGVLFVHDVIEQRNVYTNCQITDLLGYASEQVQAMGSNAIATLVHPDDLERVSAYFESFHTVADDMVLGIEYRARHATGDWRWFYTQSVVFKRTLGGSPCQILGVSIDISDRKRSEQALQQSEAWTRLATQVAQLGAWRLHLDTNQVEMDERMRQIWGESDDAVMLPLPKVLERMHPDDRERVADAVDAALNPGSSGAYEIEYRLVWNDGTERWVLAKGQAHFEGEGITRRVVDFFGTLLDITDRKRAEVALVEQEQRYRYIFEAVSVAIWEEDFSEAKAAIDQLKAVGIQDFRQYFSEYPEILSHIVSSVRIQDVNQAALQMFGAQEKAELLSSLDRVFVAETESAFIGELLAIAQGESSFAAETIVQTLQGDQLNVWFTITFPLASEPYNRVLVSILDITQRKQSELERERSEAILNAFLAASPLPLTLFDQDLRFIYANEALAQLNELPLNEHLGRTLWDIVPNMAPQFAPLLRQIIKTQEPVLNLEYSGEVRPGTYRHTIANHFPVCLPDGEVLGVGVTVTDVTELKRVEAELRQHSERLNLLYETTSDLLSAKQPLDLMNQLFSRLSAQMDLHYYYHFQVSQQNGQQRLQLMNYSGLSEAQVQALETIEFGQAMCGLVAQERHQIVLNQAEITAHPNAQTLCLMGVSAYAGQPLIVNERLLGTLSFASFSRTQFLLEEVNLLQAISEQVAIALDRAELVASLRQQAEDLAQANRVKDEFLAVLSHELRSPLNPILGWTKLLQTGRFDGEKTKQALEIIERNAKQQTQLIDDLLDISKILRGKLVLSKAPVDLALAIETALETVRLSAEAKNIQIQINCDAALPPVLGDSGRLQQVILNLLSNAIKFTPIDGQVEVRLERVTDKNRGAWERKNADQNSFPDSSLTYSYAQIQVKDNGKGIAPDFLPYVFESFRQEDGKTTRKFGGLGLGLAIVRQLTELHGGTVRAESMGEGTGATFTTCLPLMKPANLEADDSSPAHPAFSPINNQSNVLQGMRVLVVDDEPDMRNLVVALLEQAGAIVETAASAAEALTVFEQFQPMLLISDIGMPDMDGYMLMRQIRTLLPERGRETSAIALTAYASEFDQQQALKAGFQKHISKPVEPEALIQTIVDVVKSVTNDG